MSNALHCRSVQFLSILAVSLPSKRRRRRRRCVSGWTRRHVRAGSPDIARVAGFESPQFRKFFDKSTGQSDWLNSVRTTNLDTAGALDRIELVTDEFKRSSAPRQTPRCVAGEFCRLRHAGIPATRATTLPREYSGKSFGNGAPSDEAQQRPASRSWTRRQYELIAHDFMEGF